MAHGLNGQNAPNPVLQDPKKPSNQELEIALETNVRMIVLEAQLVSIEFMKFAFSAKQKI